MNVRFLLTCAALFLAAVFPAIPCTQYESEQKTREVIYAMIDICERAPAKAAEKKFDAALTEVLKPSRNSQAATDAYCKALDEIAADLKR